MGQFECVYDVPGLLTIGRRASIVSGGRCPTHVFYPSLLIIIPCMTLLAFQLTEICDPSTSREGTRSDQSHDRTAFCVRRLITTMSPCRQTERDAVNRKSAKLTTGSASDCRIRRSETAPLHCLARARDHLDFSALHTENWKATNTVAALVAASRDLWSAVSNSKFPNSTYTSPITFISPFLTLFSCVTSHDTLRY